LLINIFNNTEITLLYKITSSLILISILTNLSLNDLETNNCPENLCRLGIFSGLIFRLFYTILIGFKKNNIILIDSIVASIFVFLLIVICNKLIKYCSGISTIGIGDAKVASIGGIWLGLYGIIYALGIAFLVAGLFSLFCRISGKLKKFQAFAFVPFLSSGIIYVWFVR
tara:strand:+ start:292 stop:801 length:510 start_codon:yes stop_codon:yes gene_type:complete